MDTEHAGQCNDCTRVCLFRLIGTPLLEFSFSTTDVVEGDYRFTI